MWYDNIDKMETKRENIIIIGGGPTGLSAAVYNARAFLEPLVIAGSPPGGQLTLTSDVENYPGFESILGPELVEKYRKHAEKFGTRFVNENVASVDFSDQNNLKVKLNNGVEYSARSILIATGASAQWLGLESETRLRGRGVSACATCDGFFFKDKVVAVVGGGDTAMEEALTLTKFASKVYLIHRKDSFRASQIMQKRVLAHEKIVVLWDTEVIEVLGEDKVSGLKLKFNSDKSKDKVKGDELEVQGFFLAIGHKPSTDFLQGHVDLDKKGYVMTYARLAEDFLRGNVELSNEKREYLKGGLDKHYSYSTSVLGVFAAGDCVDHIYRQAGTAVGMGIAAALEVERYLGEKEG